MQLLSMNVCLFEPQNVKRSWVIGGLNLSFTLMMWHLHHRHCLYRFVLFIQSGVIQQLLVSFLTDNPAVKINNQEGKNKNFLRLNLLKWQNVIKISLWMDNYLCIWISIEVNSVESDDAFLLSLRPEASVKIVLALEMRNISRYILWQISRFIYTCLSI